MICYFRKYNPFEFLIYESSSDLINWTGYSIIKLISFVNPGAMRDLASNN